MTTALLLLLLSSLAWTGLDFVRKLLAEEADATALAVGLGLGQGLLLGAWGLWQGLPPVPATYWLPGLGSLALNVVGNVLFLIALTRSPYSLCLPLLALTPVFTALLGIPILHEMPGPFAWAGIGLIIGGAFWLNWPAEGGLAAFLEARGAHLMALVALIWALTSPCDKLATLATSPAFHGALTNVGIAVVLTGWLAARGKLDRVAALRPRLRLLALGSLIGAVAIGAQLMALKLLLASLVEAIKRSIGLVMAVAIGRVRFGEPLTRQTVSAIALMSAGLWLALS